jgi:hypothetical protein
MEELLVQAARSVDYPSTPDIAAAVRARLAAHQAACPRTRPVAPRWVRPLAAGLAVLAVGLVVALSASSGAREALAEFLGLRVRGERVAILTPPAGGAGATPFASPVALEYYATPVASTELEALVGFEPQQPAGSRELLGTYVIDYDGLQVAVLQFDEFDLWQVNLDRALFDKEVPFFEKGVRLLAETSVNGQPAWWIEGGGHIMRFVGSDGTVVAGSERTVDRNTLAWRSASGMNYRMETDLQMQEAVAIAQTLP